MSWWFFPSLSSRLRNGLWLWLCLCLVGVSLGCAAEPRRVASTSTDDQWQAWQILEVKTGQVLAYADWLKTLERADIVYLGEEHYNRHHVEAAIRLLSDFMSDGLHPSIGMEMFSWDGQEALDRYLAQSIQDKSVFLQQAKWSTNWGGAYDNYEPLVLFARDRHVPLQAMNPPKSLIRQVVKMGLIQAQAGEEWKFWGMAPHDIVDDPAYRVRILDQLRRCHGGGAEEDYQTMYEASMVRDEGMAQSLVAALETARNASPGLHLIVLSYTGGGHIQYNLPIPSRVARRQSGAIQQSTVYLASFDRTRISDIHELLQEGIADYIWLTPVSGEGPAQRCR
jgi:uncharacterized iron-regulated protein